MHINTLKDLLFKHNNDYGFDVIEVLCSPNPSQIPNLSIIIPYYNTGETIQKVLHHLHNSIETVKNLYSNWQFEIIVIDNGSDLEPASKFITNRENNSILISNKKNEGRSFTRQVGLKHAIHDICLFMDSDILIDSTLILNHLKLHSKSLHTKKNLLTVSFFEFADNNHYLLTYEKILPIDLRLNDYRLHCVYGPTWIGCEEDKAFIGKEFNIVRDTKEFRNWNGMYFAWAISNMILGGFFMVNRKDCIEVGGFNLSFQGYGFTETSLATKLIAIKNNYVVPMLIGGGLHIDDPRVNHTRKEKDKIFWEKHDFYFNKYLFLTPKEAVDEI